MSDPWVIAIVGGVAATVLADLLIPPVRRFLRGAGRFALRVLAGVVRVVLGALAASVPGWVLIAGVAAAALLTRATSVAAWVMVVAAGIVALVAQWIGRRRGAPIERAPTLPYPHPSPTPNAVPELNELEDAIVWRLARADGATLGIGDLSAAARTTRLRVDQALERLERIGLVLGHRNIMHGPQFRLTAPGRDFAIARQYA